jgi:hypothetical protein
MLGNLELANFNFNFARALSFVQHHHKKRPYPAQDNTRTKMDDMEIDPEIAAAMGFASFGGATKKRKLNVDEAVVDTANKGKSATGSNSQPLGQPTARPAAKEPPGNPRIRSSAIVRTANKRAAAKVIETTTNTYPASGTANLGALRKGVRNARGDTAYFLPSFLEDPWESLRKKAN